MTRSEALQQAGNANEVYFGIQRFMQLHGYSPTLDELLATTSICSKKTLMKHVRTLQGLGLVSGELKKSRTLGLVGYQYVDIDDGTIVYGEKVKKEEVKSNVKE